MAKKGMLVRHAHHQLPDHSFRITLSADGRFVLPVELRDALRMQVGDTLFVRSRNGAVEIRTREQVLKDIRESSERMLSEELISERRLKAKREADGE